MNDTGSRSTASGLLVTGLPRSGTSWVGKMLEASDEVVYVNEPMNPKHPPGRSPGVLDGPVGHYFEYISTADDDVWREAFRHTLGLRYRFGRELRRNHAPYDLGRMLKYGTSFTLGRLRGRRALLDDPYALFSAGWLAQEMGVSAVILVRDPVSWVGSWRALDWSVSFTELLDQPRLVADHLEPYADRMRELVDSPDWLARTCLLWEATYAAVDRTLRHVPGVSLVGYESLVKDPQGGFADLYGRLGLTWSERAEQQVREATTEQAGAGRGFHWSLRGGVSRTAYRPMGQNTALSTYRDRLTPEEIARVHELTAEVAARVLPGTVQEGSPSAGSAR